MSDRKTRVAAVCHHELIRIGAKMIFARDYDLELFKEATELTPSLETYKPDLIMLCLPDNARTKIVSDVITISEAAPATPIVLLSFYGFTGIEEFIAAGASGYAYTGHCDVVELLDICTRVLEGETAIDGRTASSMFTTKKTPPVTLTDREIEVVAHVAKGLSNNQIADVMHISSSTVAGHLSRACLKLEVSNGSRSQVAAIAVRSGLI